MNKSQAFRLSGQKKEYLKELISSIEKTYDIEGDYKSKKSDEITIFYRKSGKSLCYIDIKKDYVRVTVVIGKSLRSKIRAANITKDTRKMYDNAKKYYDGKWLFFDLENKSQIKDIKKLLYIKKNPPRN